jgi:hypothetical protein
MAVLGPEPLLSPLAARTLRDGRFLMLGGRRSMPLPVSLSSSRACNRGGGSTHRDVKDSYHSFS